jgi:hypothetical protein
MIGITLDNWNYTEFGMNTDNERKSKIESRKKNMYIKNIIIVPSINRILIPSSKVEQ